MHEVVKSYMGNVYMNGMSYRGRICECSCGYKASHSGDDGDAERAMSGHMEWQKKFGGGA